MLYFRWFTGFLMLMLFIAIFFFIGGNLINILLAISIVIIIYDYLKEKIESSINN